MDIDDGQAVTESPLKSVPHMHATNAHSNLLFLTIDLVQYVNV